MKAKREKIKYVCPKCGRKMNAYKRTGSCEHCGWYQRPLPR